MNDIPSAHWASGDSSTLVVGGSAAWNGLGFTPHQTWAFRRAELTSFSASPFFDSKGARVTMGHIRTLSPRLQGTARLEAVARGLIEQITPALRRLPRGARVALVLGLGERFADQAASRLVREQRDRIETMMADALRALELEVQVLLEPHGHAALAYGLLEVAPALQSRHLDAAIVGGLDTAYDAEVVEALVEEGRLFDGENLDSFIPGEGGALVLLSLPDIARRAGWEFLARLEGVATAGEAASLKSELPCQAQGATRVMRTLADQVRASRRTVDCWLADVTSERYRVHEWQLAFPRASGDVSGENARYEFLPTLLGDLGAATLPTGMMLAVEGLRRGDPRGSTCIVSASSAGHERGGLLVTALATRDGSEP